MTQDVMIPVVMFSFFFGIPILVNLFIRFRQPRCANCGNKSSYIGSAGYTTSHDHYKCDQCQQIISFTS